MLPEHEVAHLHVQQRTIALVVVVVVVRSMCVAGASYDASDADVYHPVMAMQLLMRLPVEYSVSSEWSTSRQRGI